MKLDDLASPYYREQLNQMTERWAGSAEVYVEQVVGLAAEVGAKTVLDYGCGPSSLKRGLASYSLAVAEYDPGFRGKEKLPKPVDLVVCLDVLEHVEPDKLDAVLEHICSLANKAILLIVATRPAEKRLPDGRNAHLIIDNASWWLSKIKKHCNWALSPQVEPDYLQVIARLRC